MPPTTFERGRFKDVSGLMNQVFVCYWRDPSAYVRFAKKSALHA